MSDESMTDEMTEAEPKRRGRPPKDGPSREAREPRTEVRAETGRSRRIPLGTPQSKLQARVPEGMVGRWVNDSPGRIQRALDAGYQFINDDGTTGGRESARAQIVGTQEAGGAMHGYLMAIPEQWYREDQLEKQKPLNAFEAEIKRGIIQGEDGKKEQGQFYDRGTSLKETRS